MRQLTSLDAQFLALENQRQTGHVGALAMLDTSTAPGGEVTRADICRLTAERLPLLPPMRWKLAEVPFGLDYPYWIEDPDFDLDYHIREIALPAPGSDAQLAAQVARLHSRPLDRARPLWEFYVVHGHESGQTALVSKIHHAVIDGMSGAEIMGLLLDLGPEGREPPDPDVAGERGEAPGQWEMLGRGLVGLPRYPLRALRSLPSAVPHLDETPLGALPGAGTIGRTTRRLSRAALRRRPVADRTNVAAPRTIFNGRRSPHRRFAFGQLSLEEVKAIKNEHGVTVNDVIVSICAGAVRRWLVAHDDLPDGPLIAQIPVSVRSDEQLGTYGNRILLMAEPFFVDEPDPVNRLRRTHEALMGMKERHKALPADLLQDVNHFIPPAVFSRAAQLTFRLSTSRPGRPTWNLVVSNVPGPQFPLYLAGARLEANYPISVITDGLGLNITVMSYCGHLDFGLLADRDQMPDLWSVLEALRDEVVALKAAGAPPRDSAPRRGRARA
ncbi:MAG TPA: wax ester/triacylglycerol synthase family O-acyltransferase [Solirubrobacteraceae bacterium]